jgi:Centromere DNA-binding protein complex CBF3 subunit, domain 2
MINQIAEGKTTHGKLQYGRAIRHKDVRRCAIGGIALYLMNRFEITGEFADMTLEDWKDNSKWFNVKFLVDVHSTDREVEMVSDTYADHVKAVLTKLSLPTNKLRHLGRGTGTKELDGNEVNEQEIRRMGQWNQSVYDQSYSSKLPMTAMRSLAGYTSASGMYYNPRTAVMPPMELLVRETSIGKWSFAMLEQLEDDPVDKPTATACLNWLNEICVVFLQDLAAMSYLFPERLENSALTKWMSILSSRAFLDFKDKMAAVLDQEECPLDASLEKVLPGVYTRFRAVDEKMHEIHTHVQGVIGHVDKGFESILQAQENFLRESSSILGATLINTGTALLNSPGLMREPKTPGKASGDNSPAGERDSPAESPPPPPPEQEDSPHAS